MTTLDLVAITSELRRIADLHEACDGCDEEKIFRAAADRLEAAERDKTTFIKTIEYLTNKLMEERANA